MGHLIEYLATVPETAVRSWLDRLSGFYFERHDPTQYWEGKLGDGDTFWAEMSPAACLFSLSMKYTGLWLGRREAIVFAEQFECAFRGQFGSYPLLRLDEFLRIAWEKAEGKQWAQLNSPFESLLAWLQTQPESADHWHMLGGETPSPQPDVVLGQPRK